MGLHTKHILQTLSPTLAVPELPQALGITPAVLPEHLPKSRISTHTARSLSLRRKHLDIRLKQSLITPGDALGLENPRAPCAGSGTMTFCNPAPAASGKKPAAASAKTFWPWQCLSSNAF